MRERQNRKPGSGLHAYSFIGWRFGFAKVAAPVSAFVEDFCKQIPDVKQVKNEKKSFTFRRILRHMKLSRFNHRLPRSQLYPEVVPGTAALHDQIADALLPQAEPVCDAATVLDTAVHVLDPQPMSVESLVGVLLLHGQLLAPGLLGGHKARHLREREGQEAQILHQPTARGHGRRGRIRHGLLMGAAARGVTEEED
jgi:hypothetical protein